jgi:hypothetical protein
MRTKNTFPPSHLPTFPPTACSQQRKKNKERKIPSPHTPVLQSTGTEKTRLLRFSKQPGNPILTLPLRLTHFLTIRTKEQHPDKHPGEKVDRCRVEIPSTKHRQHK